MRLPLRRGAVLALALVVLTASGAVAHPAFNPNQVPTGESVDAVLVVPHGCDPDGGMPGEGAVSPTILLDLQLVPEVTTFEAHELEGWQVEREDGVVRWSATDGGSTEPIQFPVTVAVDGPVEEPIYLSAFQECAEGSFRWIGTPDQAAEYPAVKLTPTQGEIGTEQPADGHAGMDDAEDHAEDDAHGHDPGEDEHHEEQPEAGPTDAPDEPAEAGAEASAESGVSWVVLVVLLVALLAGIGLSWARRSRGGGA